MNHRLVIGTLGVLLLLSGGRACPQGTPGNRAFNPFQTQFTKAWEVALPEQTKLFDVGPVLTPKRNNLVLLLGGRDKNDYKRRLVALSWNGLRFTEEMGTELLGTNPDALLVGHFRDGKVQPVVAPPAPAGKGKPPKAKPAPAPARQILTSEGVYEWANGTLARVCNAPANLRLAIVNEKGLDLMLTGLADASQTFALGETDVQPATATLPPDGSGYVRFGMGNQDYSGADQLTFAGGLRYAQSLWSGRNRWFIGLFRGQPAGLSDEPQATVGDQLVVFTPKLNARDKSFWLLKQTEDLEEAWRSEKLPGRVLDVRVGDPRNEGQDSILVLISEQNDTLRRLLCYTPLTRANRLP